MVPRAGRWRPSAPGGSARSGGLAEVRSDKILGDGPTHRMSGHRRDEDPTVERSERDVIEGPDGRGAGHVPDQRDLAEVRAGPELPHEPAADLDRNRALLDDVEPIAGIALSE